MFWKERIVTIMKLEVLMSPSTFVNKRLNNEINMLMIESTFLSPSISNLHTYLVDGAPASS